MISLRRAIFYAMHNKKQFIDSCICNLWFLFGDKLYLTLRYKVIMGDWINWKRPRNFNEKLQWLKLYNRKDIYTNMVDKFAVKKLVSDIIGSEYVIPTIGVWDSPEHIDWKGLPNSFVLKTTHGGGGSGVVICKDKKSIDKTETNNILKRSLKSDIYKYFREWPYKNVTGRIIAEPYLSDRNGQLNDYKFYCFDGKVKLMMMASGRFTDSMYFDYFDESGNHQDITWGKPQNPVTPILPRNFDKMKEIASKLSQNIPHVRVDLYDVDGNILFGELTFFDGSGFEKIYPERWNIMLGENIKINNNLKN